MRLLRAELSRLFARRFTKVMLLVLVLAMGVVGGVTASQTHRPTPTEIAEARDDAAKMRIECETEWADEQGDVARDDCQFTAGDFMPYVLDFRDEAPELLLVFVALFALFGYLVGASFIGVEWSSGGMSNLLLWRSRRLRVMLGKLIALSFGMLLTGAFLGAGWLAAIYAIARYRGSYGDLTPGFWTSLALDGARGLGLALLTALTGAALASLGRRTAAALGVLIGYLVVWEIGARAVMHGLKVMPDPYMLSTYGFAFLTKEFTIYPYPYGCLDPDACTSLLITWQHGLAAVGGVALLTVLVAAISFRRRDIA